MSEKKRTFFKVTYALAFLVLILLSFGWYTRQNNKRIERQNLNYAADSARQIAFHITNEFENSLNQVKTYAYFLDENLSEPEVTADVLKEIEKNSSFDAFRYVDSEGNNLASDGKISDASDRDYYLNSMDGKSGISVIFHSRLTEKALVGFYTPVHYQGEVIGGVRGVYWADEYLHNMLKTSYFGHEAGVYLCTEDGQIVSSSTDQQAEGNFLTWLDTANITDWKEVNKAKDIFANGGEGSLRCNSSSRADNISVIHLPDSPYVLVQTFPRVVTQQMVKNANFAGIVLEIMLLGLFAVYLLALLVHEQKERKRLKKENLEMGYVISGIHILFSRFAMIDLKKGVYQYLAGTKPKQENFAPSGSYDAFVGHLCSLPVRKSERQKFEELFADNGGIEQIPQNDSLRYEYDVERDGKSGWECLNIVCLEQEEGRTSKVLLLWQNTTEAKEKELRIRAEIALANRKERQYRVAITADSICTYDFNLTHDRIEQDILRKYNGREYSLLERVGLTVPCKASRWFELWENFVAEESLEVYRETADIEHLRDYFRQGGAEAIVEYWNINLGGEKIYVRQSFIMTRDDETGDIMVMVVTKDITEQIQKQAEQTQALQDALMQAQYASNAKTTFLSNMSHDIRTPMNAIIGFTTIAISHIDNRNQVKDCLNKVLSSGNHLLSLINDILDMSRIESGKVHIKEQECNISELMHSLVNIIQPQVKAKQLELFIDTFDISHENIIADSLKLNQVFVNLISNAVKYTPAGGTIIFQIRQKAVVCQGYGEYVFIVRDNGIGMSPEFVKHIFEPFEREASATKSGIVGTGLGMSITKNIVDMMGGSITVYSEKGKGSEFIVELKLKLQDLEKSDIKIKELTGKKVLVVDDDMDTCSSVSKMLRHIGMCPEFTTSGKEAVCWAKDACEGGGPYHTYIIDWQMPEMSGIETAKRILSIVDGEAPVLIMTAYDWADIEEEAKAIGVTAFCAKPLFMSDLRFALLSANHLIEQEEEKFAWTMENFSGKRVLLVEDNELNREIAEEILKETGFIIETAPDGADAVEMMKKAREYYYDAILMDVQMPIMDGYEATRTIRALPREDVKDLPIIAMTANAMDEDREAALKNGMNAHIAKPIDIDTFLAVLKQFFH